MKLTEKQFIKLLAIWKMERELTKNMKDFVGSINQITVSPLTRLIRKNPSLVKKLDETLDILEANKKT